MCLIWLLSGPRELLILFIVMKGNFTSMYIAKLYILSDFILQNYTFSVTYAQIFYVDIESL